MNDPIMYVGFLVGVFSALSLVTVGSVVSELARRLAERHDAEYLEDYEVFEEAQP